MSRNYLVIQSYGTCAHTHTSTKPLLSNSTDYILTWNSISQCYQKIDRKYYGFYVQNPKNRCSQHIQKGRSLNLLIQT